MTRWQKVSVCSVVLALGLSGAAGAGSEALGQRIDVDLEDVDVRQVLQSFGEILDAEEIVIDPALDGELDIRLENVRVETVLNAACDSLGCVWSLENGVLRFEASAEKPTPGATGLDARIDMALEDASLRQVLESFAGLLQRDAKIAEELRGTIDVSLENASVGEALDHVCEKAGCTWELDEEEAGKILRFDPE